MHPAVYRLTSRADGRSFVAGSLDADQHYKWLVRALKAGRHANEDLQAAWDRLGPAGFEYVELEALATNSRADVRRHTRKWIERLASDVAVRGYNVWRRKSREPAIEARSAEEPPVKGERRAPWAEYRFGRYPDPGEECTCACCERARATV